ncbi:MAG: hypothetical protein ACRCU5_14135, partial [Rhizobiaceae bacterium]
LTSMEDKLLLEQLRHLGVEYALTKPVRTSLLQNTVNEIVVSSFNRRRRGANLNADIAVERRAAR